MMAPQQKYDAVAIAGSAGSLEMFGQLVAGLSPGFDFTVIVLSHLHPQDDGGFHSYIKDQCSLPVKEAADKEKIAKGTIFVPPADYHLLIEREKTFSLTRDNKVNFSRPSFDVFFDSAAACWGKLLVGILLTGASSDGAAGLAAVKKFGGLTIAQSPAEAPYPVMPQAAINTGSIDKILTLGEICHFLNFLPTLPSEMGRGSDDHGR